MAGRKKIEIDWATVEKLCLIQCTATEIAGVLGISDDTLARAIKREYKKTFPEYYKSFQGKGKASLRRLQWKSAEHGNVAMQIWLGKQYLGQQDRKDIDVNESNKVVIINDIPKPNTSD